MIRTGDTVTPPGLTGEFVVVDITGDGMAILRRPADTEGRELIAISVEELT